MTKKNTQMVDNKCTAIAQQRKPSLERINSKTARTKEIPL